LGLAVPGILLRVAAGLAVPGILLRVAAGLAVQGILLRVAAPDGRGEVSYFFPFSFVLFGLTGGSGCKSALLNELRGSQPFSET